MKINQTVNWVYHASAPDIEKQVSDTIYAAHKYRNRLCELELERRARHDKLIRKLAPTYLALCDRVDVLDQEIQDARDAIQAERVKQRTKRPKGVTHLTAKVTQLKAERKAVWAKRKEAKAAANQDPAVQSAIKANEEEHKRECRLAKEAAGLYWGTEGMVTEATKSFKSKAPPRFKRFEGEGQLAVQIQNGMPVDNALKRNTLFWIDTNSLRGDRVDCYIRIASLNRAPVFACLPITMHRPLPPGGRIKRVYLEKRLIADHVRWSIRLTVDIETDVSQISPEDVAIHTGWKMEPGGLRVATWLGSDGATGVLRLPREHCADYEKLDAIRSERDRHFNEERDHLRSWIKSQKSLPDWFKEEVSHIHKWRSPKRMARLILHWRDNRFAGDTPFARLDGWRKLDKKRWQHERRLAFRIRRRRQDAFRVFVSDIAAKYGVAYVSPIDAQRLTENSNPEDLDRDNTKSHRHAKWAAVSELVETVREKFVLRCVSISANNISRECSKCGHVNDLHRRKVQCGGCGNTYDVDENAVIVTLARGQIAKGSGALLELKTAHAEKEQEKRERQKKKEQARRDAFDRRKKAEEKKDAG